MLSNNPFIHGSLNDISFESGVELAGTLNSSKTSSLSVVPH